MKHFFLFFVLVTAIFFESHASENQDKTLFIKCGGKFDLCGYTDSRTNDIVIGQRFERAMLFSEGLAAVRIKGRFGYIDTNGKVVIAPKYDLAGPFYQNMAEVMVDGHTGIINRDGDWLVKPKFARSIPFTKDVAIVRIGKWENYFYSGSERLEGLKDGSLGTEPFGLYHFSKGWIVKPKYKLELFEGEGRGLIWATDAKYNEDNFGLLQSDGKWLVSPQYSHVQRLSDGLAIVVKTINQNNTAIQKWGAVDAKGSIVIPTTYQHLSYWNSGYGIAYKDNKEGLLDKSGNLLGGEFFDKVQKPEGEESAKVQINNIWYDISTNGELTKAKKLLTEINGISTKRQHKLKIQDILHCDGGIDMIEVNGLWGMNDSNGEVILPPIYRAVDCFKQGITWVPIDEEKKWCPIGIDGKRQDKPDCVKIYYPFEISHHAPEKFDEDSYESSVLWVKARIDYALGKRKVPPKFIGDGVQGFGSQVILQ